MVGPAKVACIILNFRTPALALGVADRISTMVDFVLLVENGSGDASAETFQKALPGAEARSVPGGVLHVAGPRALLVLPENLGFSDGNNLGIRAALGLWNPSHVLIHSPDSSIPEEALRRALDLAEGDRVGAVGMTAPPRPEFFSRVRPRQIGIIPRPRVVAPDASESVPVHGSAMLFTSDCARDLEGARGGIFPGRFFLLVEQYEVGWTLRLRGWRVYHHWHAGVHHAGQASRRTLRGPVSEYYEVRNWLMLARSLPPARGLWTMLWTLTWALADVVSGRIRGEGARAIAQGIVDGCLNRGGKWTGQR